jgi:hypothetical protein
MGCVFRNCKRLSHCVGYPSGMSEQATVTAYGFHNCASLSNCEVVNGTNSQTLYGVGYYGCERLNSCICRGRGDGFDACTDLSNCRFEGAQNSATGANGLGEGFGFKGCANLSNCYAKSYGHRNDTYNPNNDGIAYGFKGCQHLTNCTGEAYGGYDVVDGRVAYGFYECTHLVNCVGSSYPMAAFFPAYYGFYNCKGIMLCRSLTRPDVWNTGYANCRVDFSGTTNATDTAAGGWNSTDPL